MLRSLSSAASSASTALCEGGSLRLGHLGDYSFTVFVEEVESLLTVLGVAIGFTLGEVVLQIDFESGMLSAALSKKDV